MRDRRPASSRALPALGLTAALTLVPAHSPPPALAAPEDLGPDLISASAGEGPAAAPLELVHAGDPQPAPARGSDLAPFTLKFGDVLIPYPVLAVTVLPGESVDLAIEGVDSPAGLEGFRLRDRDGVVASRGLGRWTWTAPAAPGAVPLRAEGPDGAAIQLNVLVLHPFDEIDRGGELNGYPIGRYVTGPGRSDPPAGFIEGDQEILDLSVAPDFTLRQFLCKEPGEPPYLALSEPLLVKLETILTAVRATGVEARTLQVMSGFRTPVYNRAIGNVTDGSRHLWGDAADVFVDVGGDGWMDDLTGDGRVDLEDGRVLFRIAERVEQEGEDFIRPGGLSLYPANSVHGPFVHVDARGFPARW